MNGYLPYIWQDEGSNYQEIKPAIALGQLIDCYWLSYPELGATRSRVIPDLCADIILSFNVEGELTSTIFSGANSRYFITHSQQPLLVGIRFYLPALAYFFKENLTDTRNQLISESTDLERFTSAFQESYCPPFSIFQVVAQLNTYFLQELKAGQPNTRLTLIQSLIHNSFMTASYQSVIAKETLSERTIQRHFRHITGLSPYEVFEVVRFQKVLQRLRDDPKVTPLDLVHQYDFYDQAHYARSLKKISGLTPTAVADHCRNYPSQTAKIALH